ncbi:MAG: glycosyltransferase [Acidobacteriaceae bacterium]
MQIIQAVFGTFHHFELARELNAKGHLERIYSTFPWRRLRREGVSRDKVEMFPWIHTPLTVLGKYGLKPAWLEDEFGYLNALAFDEWTARRIPECDAFIAISGAGLKTGKLVQQRGGKFICDRGSAHTRYQDRIVTEEFRRWGVNIRPNDERDNLREEEIYQQADVITVPSSFVRRSFIEMGISAEKVHTIPYGVRLENFFPVATPPSDSFEVLFVGSVSLRKGIPYLLEAFSRLKHPRKHLRVIGALHDSVKPVLSKLPQEYVEFTGAVDQQAVREAMSTSHVLVLPSIEEGLALVQGQALACGCPVIASTNAGAEDLFADEVEGFIVPIRDVDVLTQRMQQLADDPLLQKKMSEAALARVQKIGGWHEYGNMWERTLKNLPDMPLS